MGIYLLALNLWGASVATAATFLTISFTELMQAFNIRTERLPLYKSGIFGNKVLLITVAGGILVNVLLAVSPLAPAFGLVNLNAVQWLAVFGFAASVLPVGELYKYVLRKVIKKKLKKQNAA